MPTIFDYAYEFQKRVLCGNVISNFFAVAPGTKSDGTDFSSEMAVTLFQSFFYVKTENNSSENPTDLYNNILSDDGVSLANAFESVKQDEKSLFDALGNFDEAFDNGELGYLYLVSTAAGLYCAYVLLGFVIDIAVRSVKLSYLQIVAPLPIMTMVIPNQKKVFDNWLKKTTSCFLEVFVRVIAITFAAYAVRYLPEWVFGGDMATCGEGITGIILLLTKAAFILGIFGFLKQAPKLIGELFPGFDSKGLKLGFKESFAEVGGFRALGAAGGFASSAAKNAAISGSRAFQNAKQNFNQKPGLGRLIGGTFATLAGGAAGAVAGGAKGGYKGFIGAKDAKKLSDSKSAADKAAEDVIEERFKKEEKRQADAIAHEDWGVQDYVKDAVSNFISSDRANYNFQNNKHSRLSAVETAKKSIDTLDDTVLSKKAKDLNFSSYVPDEKNEKAKQFLEKLEKIDSSKSKEENRKLSWDDIQMKTKTAEQAYNSAVQLNTEAESMVGDEKFSTKYILNARNVADAKVQKISEKIANAGLNAEELEAAKAEYKIALNEQQIAYSLTPDYSRTPEYVENLKKQRKKAMEETKATLKEAQDFEKDYKKFMKEYIHGQSNEINDTIGEEFKEQYINEKTNLESKIKAALGDLSSNPSRYKEVVTKLKLNDIVSLLSAADSVKKTDLETLKIINSIAEEMRKKEESKK